jgi:uncharacterized protein (TIGR02996 family)
MTEEETFLSAIIAQPDDDTVRLVYADWLAEHGAPDRGEFIRVEIELAHTPPDSETAERRRSVLFGRQAELLKKHKKEWLAPFGRAAKESSFERGFVQALQLDARTFIEHGERWAALTPLTRVKITTCIEWGGGTRPDVSLAPQLFASPVLARLVVLDLETLRLTAADLQSLATHPDLSRLRELILTWNPIGDEGAALLANMPQLSGLEVLDIRSASITDFGARAIALSQHLNGLKELRIFRHNTINNATWELLDERFGGIVS